MSVKIVITNHGSRLNKGNQALLTSRITMLRNLIPDAEFTVFTHYPHIENEIRDVKTMEVIGKILLPRSYSILKKDIQTLISLIKCGLWSFLNTYFHCDINALRNGNGLNEYYNADVVISTGGDILTEDYGKFEFYQNTINYIFALLLKKPVVIYV